MRFKRFLYSVLLLLFTLTLLADLGLWFLVPDGAAETGEDAGTAFVPPAGVSFPTDGSLPEGMTLPEGMSFPTDGSLPEGVTRPGSGERSEGTGRRARRSGTSDEAETAETQEAASSAETSTAAEPSPLGLWFSAQVETVRQYLPLTELAPLRERVYPYRLYILVGAALGMVLCLLRLIFLGKKLRQQQEADPGSLRRVALWPALLLLLGALVLVVLLFPVNEEEQEETDGVVTNAQVLSGTVAEKTLTSLIQSAGALEEQEAETLTVPASITVASVCVRNGDEVTAGQIVARADRTSVMQAVAKLQEALDEIDGQLQKAHEAKAETSLSAPVAGTVKAVYAQPGEKVTDVMNEHGSLMLLSLDGRMAVQVPATDDLIMGSAAVVTLSNGTALAGEVSFLEEGVATVTVTDRGYAIGEQVSVKDAQGVLLGSGALYVHKPLDIVGYLGTVTRVYRSEGSTVYAGAALLGLADTEDLADYRQLLQQRADYEAELKTLFELYETGYIHAPCDGVVQGLSDELTYTSLADMAAGLSVRRLAAGPADAEPTEYVHYVGEVQENDDGRLYLKLSTGPVTVTSYSFLPALPASTMEGSYTIPGSVPIYQAGGGWSSMPSSQIRAGDRILFAFDQEGTMVWVIVAHTATVTPTPTPSPTPTPRPTPDASTDPDAPGAPGESPAPSGGTGGRPGGGRSGGSISFRIPSSGGSGGKSGAQQAAYTIAEKELCTVTPQERMLVTVPIDELDVLALSLGQEADMYLDALPATRLVATVTKIDAEGENSGGNTKYSVTLSLDRGPQLYPGMNATVCFPRQEVTSTATVPLAALAEEGGRTLVYTAYDRETDQLLAPVEVKTGVSDGTDVEILSGLAPGESYYYRYADAISYVTVETSP